MADEIRYRVALACSRRALDQDALTSNQTPDDPKLLIVCRQREINLFIRLAGFAFRFFARFCFVVSAYFADDLAQSANAEWHVATRAELTGDVVQ